jgi:hypothetical protein
VNVQGLDGRVIRSVSLGADHSCAVLNDNSVSCWGSNSIWQLGNENPEDQLTPVPVAGLEGGVQSVAVGRTHSCALTMQGAVLCWGRNDGGQLGDGSSLNRAEPVPVSGLSRGVLAIDSGAEHSCALLDIGAIRCWGSNYSGQFGDGTFGGRPVPVEVKRDDDARRRPTPASDAAVIRPASDASGRYLVFESRAEDLIAGDSNGSSDVFRVDTHSGDVVRISVDNAGAQLSGDASEASISADGQRGVFTAPDAAVNRLLGESCTTKRGTGENSQLSGSCPARWYPCCNVGQRLLFALGVPRWGSTKSLQVS